MVATADIGRLAAQLLQERWDGLRVVELEGPRPVSPDDIAQTFARLLKRDVRMQVVPRDTWESLFRAQRMQNPTPRIQMLDWAVSAPPTTRRAGFGFSAEFPAMPFATA